MSFEEVRTDANGLSFSTLAGGGDGPLALCLHGFPDSAWTWRHLLPALAGVGFRAVAPFMRGYAPTDIPADSRYQTGVLSLDACALHEALGGDERAVLIGHDWGAMAAYGAAAWEPDRWRRVVTMAVPPAGSVMAAFGSYDQLRRSWYTFFFQHPLADVVVPADDLAFIDRLWADWSPGYDAADDLPLVKEALGGADRVAAALGYYRATIGGVGVDPDLDAVQSAGSQPTPQPTLYLHGTDDGCMGVELVEGAEDHLPAAESRVELIDGAGHFLHLERPDHVNGLIVDFVTA